MRDLSIRAVLNGYIVSVGCQIVVFESRTKLLTELGRYLEDPDKVEKEYLVDSINSKQIVQPQAMATEATPHPGQDVSIDREIERLARQMASLQIARERMAGGIIANEGMAQGR